MPWICKGEWRYSSTNLSLGTRRSEWSASHPGRFTSGERAPGAHWIGGRVGPRVGLDAVKRKIYCPCRESNPARPDRSYPIHIKCVGCRMRCPPSCCRPIMHRHKATFVFPLYVELSAPELTTFFLIHWSISGWTKTENKHPWVQGRCTWI
jgi:hypothetical protein